MTVTTKEIVTALENTNDPSVMQEIWATVPESFFSLDKPCVLAQEIVKSPGLLEKLYDADFFDWIGDVKPGC